MDEVKAVVGVIAGAVAGLWGSLEGVVQVLLVLMVLDVATGMGAAFVARKLNSSIGWKGVSRKALTLGVVAMAAVVQPVLGGVPAAMVVAGFYCAVEALSILENAVTADVPVPAMLREALARLQAQSEADRQPLIARPGSTVSREAAGPGAVSERANMDATAVVSRRPWEPGDGWGDVR